MFAPGGMNYSASFSLPEYQPHLERRPSMSWRPEVGLPPPPSEIDRYQNLHHALVPSSTSYRGSSPSSYDLQFGGEVGPSEAMNTVTKHPKLKLKIVLSSSLYEAGGSISGSLEVTSSTSQRLRLGEIAIELEAFEELTSRDHSATQIFLFNRTLFQGEHLPPSNAVLPAAPIHGHWTARKGRTTFPFSFRLPATAPSSINFAGNAHLRYGLKGTVQTWWNETKSIVTARADAFVVERWHDELDSRYLEPLEAVADTHIFMGGSGAIWLEAGVMEQLFAAGGLVMIRAGVKNNTKRHISGIKVSIARRLVFPVSGMPGVPAQRQPLEPQITEVVHSQMFKGPSFEFPPNEEVVANLAVDLPRDLRTIRKTRLFEVQIVAQVSAQMGNFAKDLTVEIPIYVAHSSSLQRASPSGPLQPLHQLPQRSRSAMSQHGYHDVHPILSPPTAYSPQMLPMEAYGAERGWSPAPCAAESMGPPSRPSSAAPNVGSAYRYSPSPDQFAFVPGRLGQEPQVMWNPSAAIDHTQALLQQLPPRPVSAQELNIHPQRSATAGSTHRMTQQRQYSTQVNASTPQQHNSVGPSSPQSQLILSQTIEPVSPPQQATHTQSGITVSQLLNLGAVPIPGLATIEEDSESAAGTVRSMRTFVGSGGRNDIAQFEAMVDIAQEEEERKKDIIHSQPAPEVVIDKTLPEPPVPSAKMTAFIARPRASELFAATSAPLQELLPLAEIINITPAPSPSKTERQLKVTATPSRPQSAQGQGLMALESRLGSQKQSDFEKEAVSPTNHMQETTNDNFSGSKRQASERGGLRAAAAIAMERERKAKQESEESAIRRQIQAAQAKAEQEEKQREQEEARDMLQHSRQERAKRIEAQEKEATRVKMEQAREEKGERKAVDAQEQKMLNKEAVGRIAGWLSTSPNNSRGVGDDDAVDPSLSPVTPSPSSFQRQDCADDESCISEVRDLDRLKRVDQMTPSLSADLRALIDSSDARPAPKQGTAIRSHIGSRRFSGDGKGDTAMDFSRFKQVKAPIPSPASRGIPTSRVSLSKQHGKEVEVKKLEVKDEVACDKARVYGTGSARGGKGGRVASVANMWASIADGTDGSMIKSDDVPVLTLRPKALRSGASGSSALDFSKTKKTDEPKKPSARDIFAGPQLVSREASRGPPLKTKKAATFVNTTMPKPVFAKASSSVPAKSQGASPPRLLSIKKEETALPPGLLKESRKLASDCVIREAKLKTGRDLQVESDTESLLGRGTTKPIGKDKLADLRSLWGS